MVEKMTDDTQIEFEESSGNVFADLELEDADELHARGLMGLLRILVTSAGNSKKLRQVILKYFGT